MSKSAIPLLSWVFVCCLLVQAAGCERLDPEASYVVRDSAGVRIVESLSPSWEPGDEWAVASEPTLSIGQRDGEEAYQFFDVAGAVRFDDGRIVALDRGTKVVRVFGADGGFLLEFGGAGEGPGEFMSPGEIHRLRPDTLVLWDGGRPGFSLYTAGGQLIRTLTIDPPGSERLTGLEPLPDGRFLLETYASPLTQNPRREVGIHRDQAPLILLGADAAILDTVGIFPSTDLAIVRMGGGMGMGMAPFGKATWFDTQGDAIVVGTADAMEVSVFNPDGVLEAVFRSTSVDLTVGEEDREWFIEQFSKRIETPEEREMFGTVVEGMEFPETKAAYGGMLVDPVGNVWLRTGRHFAPEAPSREWTIFSFQGMLLGTVQMPESFEAYEIGSDYVLGVWEDEMDVEFVRLYELLK